MDPAPPPPLPDDALASVLRGLAPRDLAVSRCVCKAWRRVVDDRRLLRADLLPRSLGGIFLNLHGLWFTQFLARPTTGAAVSGRLDYTVPGEPDRLPIIYVRDHCNGLLLLKHCVVNPATRQWALLPPRPDDLPQPPPPGMDVCTDEYLVFDPTLSPDDFELFILPSVPHKLKQSDEECEESEWPPSTLILSVFSSKTGLWEEREFGREGAAAGTLPGMVGSVRSFFDHQGCYWRGALYVCCSDCFVMRISLSNSTYRVIRLPTEGGEFYLGKSIKGVYCASLFQESQLQIWFLNDECGHDQTEWVLKHDRDIFPILPNLNYDEQCDGPWILQEFYYWGPEQHYDEISELEVNEVIVEDKMEEKFEWDSDNDNVLEPGSRSNDSCIVLLGFHPYKKVVFLSDKFDRVLAYNWSISKLQDLGKLFPKFYIEHDYQFFHRLVSASFPYTPCWLGELPEKLNSEARLQD
ncbi:unnamed protein product [Urochloa decumbens]|uniref:F-box domain-containing protein n=1 Tax=Urochloa decumbens TaxID=240449 RepID=A0ABC9AQ21_9POAL